MNFSLIVGTSAASHVDEKELLPSTGVAGAATPADVFLGKPRTGEYAGEAAKEFFRILEAVAQEILVPGVPGVAFDHKESWTAIRKPRHSGTCRGTKAAYKDHW
ncbi:hypothetical protein LshimejAT787_1203740 [Lyophyllum shimeji]|uniref:Uncharacterized protein n=1 Tax=Lyophyllum shimeji TaxID=47721 RepID=A0A9P3USV5_LYOSH|nr:hypothetical protein LshimejAT787_1203740 [Lyophyllum shimeji]